MKEDEFKTFVIQNTNLMKSIERAASAGVTKRYGAGLTEAVLLFAMFPIIRFILTGIGLPWLYEARRYSELWRQRFHHWIDSEYQKHNLDPDEAERVGDALLKELKTITDRDDRAAWEKLTKLLSKKSQ